MRACASVRFHQQAASFRPVSGDRDHEGESRSTTAVTVLGHTFRRSLLHLFSVSERTADENEFYRPSEAL